MKKYLAFSAVLLMIFGALLCNPKACCPDHNGTQPPPDNVAYNVE